MDSIGYYNGEWGKTDNIKIPMGDRACYFGDGAYDATLCRKNVPVYLDEHIERFTENCRKLGIEPRKTKAELHGILMFLASKVDGGDKLLYWQYSRGTAMRSHACPDDVSEPNMLAMITPVPPMERDHELKLITAKDIRYLMCNIKTLNLLPSVLVSNETKKRGCDEAVLHRDGRVTECAHSNVSILKNGTLITAPADCYILPGIARAHLLSAAKGLGIPVSERPYTLEELFGADEVIVSSSSKICARTCEIDGKPVAKRDLRTFSALRDCVFDELDAEVEKISKNFEKALDNRKPQ